MHKGLANAANKECNKCSCKSIGVTESKKTIAIFSGAFFSRDPLPPHYSSVAAGQGYLSMSFWISLQLLPNVECFSAYHDLPALQLSM